MKPSNVREDNIQEQQVNEEITHAEKLHFEEMQREASLRLFAEQLKELYPDTAPDLAQLKNWKSSYGNIYMNTVTEDSEAFIWRPLLRLEWKDMISKVDMNNEILRQDYILEKCLLFPSTQTVQYKYGAGYSKSLESAIMFQSGFVDERLVISSIRIIE